MPVMVTMQRLLGRLAAGFALTAGGFSSYVYSRGLDGQAMIAQAATLRPVLADAVDKAVIDGQEALNTLRRTANEALQARNTATPPSSGDQQARAELPFRIVSSAETFAFDPYRRGSKVEPSAVSGAAAAGARGLVEPLAPLSAVGREVVALPGQALAEVKPSLPTVQSLAPLETAKPNLQLADGVRGTDPARISPLAERIKSRVGEDMRKYFDLYLYVSKAEKGGWAQKMHVMAKQPDDSLVQVHQWIVSTGKEEMMRNPHGEVMNTDTPEGFFRLDRYRFHEDYTSRQWKAPMPNAMFFDWQIEGRPSGLAIHGTGPNEEQDLGKRASKGCIRLAPEDAKALFKLITENYSGRVPQLKIDPNTGTQSTNGLMRRDANGRILTKYGYRVLVVIENYGGPTTETVATIM